MPVCNDCPLLLLLAAEKAMSKLSSTGINFSSNPSLANLIASCFSAAARFF